MRKSRFETTRWSLVLAAGGAQDAAASDALATLCEIYWYPLYAYARRQGHDPEDAKDLTQSFFALLLERRDVRAVRRERGRFRSFLLASMRHFLLNQAAYRRAQKRGGGRPALPLEFDTAEGRYLREPADADTPETIFDRRWALTVLDRVLQRLRRDWTDAGKLAQFDHLTDFPHITPSISGGEIGGAHLEERDDLLLQGIERRLEGLDPAVAVPEVVALQ